VTLRTTNPLNGYPTYTLRMSYTTLLYFTLSYPYPTVLRYPSLRMPYPTINPTIPYYFTLAYPMFNIILLQLLISFN